MNYIEYIAKLLRAPEQNLDELFARMEAKTGKTGVAEKIFQENQSAVAQKLSELGIDAEKADSQFVETEILKKAKEADASFMEYLGHPDLKSQAGCQKLADLAKEIKPGNESGFFLKEEKMRAFLHLNPPKNILEALGYSDVGQMLEKEDLFEIYAALRFIENERWLNEVFFRPYNDLIAENFEQRSIVVKALSEKWAGIAEKFVGKKLHGISHLKEAGLIFIIPLKKENFPGQGLETFSLILHYFHEVGFYSNLFEKYAAGADFGANLVRLLSGVVTSDSLPKEGIVWRIVQRYLAKNDPHDPRLFEPHVNPETIHWLKAEKEMDDFAQKNPQIKLNFWRGVDDFVGEIFPAGKKGEEIISFDLLDNLVSLTRGGLGKYLYHQQEALWNKIFIEYFGEDELEKMVIENIERGYIRL